MGAAEDWQARVEAILSETSVTIYNPRRDDWDPSWSQDPDNKNLRDQILWELQALEEADTIAIYIDPETKSPITLLELGLHAHTGKLIVFCPPGFYRYANIYWTCVHHNISLTCDFDHWMMQIVESIHSKPAFDDF